MTNYEDKRETIELDITEEEFLHIARLAHERDITFNQMVERILQAAIDAEKDLLKDEPKTP